MLPNPNIGNLERNEKVQFFISAFHFHRIFKAHTGLTPKQYAIAHRAGRVREELARAGSVTDPPTTRARTTLTPPHAPPAER